MKCYNVSANRYNGFWNGYNDGYADTGTDSVRRVWVQRVFSKKKTDRPFSSPYPCTRLPAYTRARVQIPRVPGTDTRVRIVPGGF
jgi:hypothetical protein